MYMHPINIEPKYIQFLILIENMWWQDYPISDHSLILLDGGGMWRCKSPFGFEKHVD